MSCPLGRDTKHELVEINHVSKSNHSFLIDSDPINTQQLDTLQIRKWNQTYCRSERRRIRKLHRSGSRPNWVNPKLKNRIFMMPHTMASYATNNLLEVLDRFHTINRLRLPLYMVSASIGTFPCFMRGTKVTLCTGSGHNIICHSEMSLLSNVTCV